MAAASGAFEGGGVGEGRRRRRHEFAAAVEGVSAEAGGVVLEALAVEDSRR